MNGEATKLAEDIGGLAGKLKGKSSSSTPASSLLPKVSPEVFEALKLAHSKRPGMPGALLEYDRALGKAIGKVYEKDEYAKYLELLHTEEGYKLTGTKPAYASSGNPNSCRLCGRDTMSVFGNIEAMKSTVELVKTLRDPRYIETFNMKDWADKLDRALVNAYKTCSLKDFPAMRFRIGELRKDIIKSDWPAVGSRLLDIEARLSMAFETSE